MSEIYLKASEPSKIGAFLAKTIIATAASIFGFFVAAMIFDYMIDSRLEQLAFPKGGHYFWTEVEYKLYRMLAEQDLSPEKKRKIDTALREVSAKYRPYIEALEEPSNQPDNLVSDNRLDAVITAL